MSRSIRRRSAAGGSERWREQLRGVAMRPILPRLHVYPTHDEREHVTDASGVCWCGPTIENRDPLTGAEYTAPLVIHRDADQRRDEES